MDLIPDEDMPPFLREMLMRKMMERLQGMKGPIEGEVSPLPDVEVHPLLSRVTLTPEARKKQKTICEPSYGVIVYNAPTRQWVVNGGDPCHALEPWDCIVAVRHGERIKLFLYEGKDLRAPKEENLDLDEVLDSYRLPERSMYLCGDVVCLDPDKDSGYAFPNYPAQGVVVDVLPETVFYAENTNTVCTLADCIIRCKAPSGTEECYLIHSSLLIPYSVAAGNADN